MASRKSTRRPIWASVCSRNAANASCRRQAKRRWLSDRSSHGLDAGVAAGPASVPSGTMPSSSWRANHSLPRDVPALVEAAPVLAPGTRAAPGAARGWRRRRGRGRTAGPGGRDRRSRIEPIGVVDEVLGHVVAVLGAAGRVDVVVVVGQLGVELVGLALEEAVEAVEALLQRPVVVRAGGRALAPSGARCHLPSGEGGVAVVAAAPRPRVAACGVMRAPHVREAGVPVRDAAHADRVVVAAGQQAGPSRRAQRGGVEVGVAQAARRRAGRWSGVSMRRAVAAEVGEAGVVEDDHHHVGRPGPGRVGRGPGGVRPPRLGVLDQATDPTGELRLPRRAHGRDANY